MVMRNQPVRSEATGGQHHRSGARHPGTLALLFAALLLAAASLGQTPAAPQPAGDPRADRLLVVDCLLPGQIRHLGQRTVYVSPRRPARLPARDCEIRGGEYVAYDRADLRSALTAWLPLAEQGDFEAQVIVGEMYERGMGVAADFASALAWYRRAADAGNRRAQINLGYLYERGLGVPADAAIALDWYRRAAGREVAILLDPPRAPGPPAAPAAGAAPVVDGAGSEQLQARTRELEAALEQLRSELAASRRELDDSQQQLAASRSQAEAAQQQMARSRAQLEASRAELEAARSSAAVADSRAAEAQRTLESAERTGTDRSNEVAALQQELERRSREAAVIEQELAAARTENNRRQQELAQTRTESAAARAAAGEERSRLALTAARLAESERQLAAQRAATDRLGRELGATAALASTRQQQAGDIERRLTQAEAEAAARRQEAERLGRALSSAEATAAAQQARLEELQRSVAAGLLAGPEIALVMPELKQTRDIVPVARAAGGEAQVVGRVTAPAGVVAVTVNEQPVKPNDLGVFSLVIPLAATEAPVSIVAVDRQGKRSELRFLLRGDTVRPPAADRTAASGSRALAASVDFGSYHALIIGNNDYRHLPDLASPINDATELARLLERRYGFRTTVLQNADRYQILSALNTLRESLTAKDNLLVFYAGHGELDEVNQRGHWLPVDAERDSTANWIPSTAVTDILNIMRAKQILLVVDSCYAGALTRSSVARLRTGMTADEQLHWFRTMASKRSRTVLTSGGIAPVLDAGAGRHSVFAKALLEVLEASQDTLDGQRLYREVAARVAYAAANLRFEQVPEYAPIRHAGHEAGEFFLIPRS